MRAKPPFPLLHVRPPSGPGSADSVAELVEALRAEEGVDQREVVLPAGPWPLGLWRVGRALGELIEPTGDAPEAGASGGGQGDGDRGETRRRAVQWPVPDRWPVVHAHGAGALRAVWVAAAWRGSGARVIASPCPTPAGGEAAPPPAEGGVRAAPWRKADLVAAPDDEARQALCRRGVEHRRLRVAPPGDAEAALRLYRRLAYAERRSVQRVDWSVAMERVGSGRTEDARGAGSGRQEGSAGTRGAGPGDGDGRGRPGGRGP